MTNTFVGIYSRLFSEACHTAWSHNSDVVSELERLQMTVASVSEWLLSITAGENWHSEARWSSREMKFWNQQKLWRTNISLVHDCMKLQL